MADENSHAQVEWPRKRQRTKGPADTENASGALSDPIKRTTRACDQCRTQKKRCDSGQPCQTCTKASLDCRYGKQARKRGFPTGYVRIIEALWALVFRAVPGSQETALYLLRNASVGYDDEGKATLLNFHFDIIESSRKAWLSSSVRHEIDRFATKLDDGERIGLVLEQGTSKCNATTIRTNMPPASDFTPWTIADDVLRGKLSCEHIEDVAAPENLEAGSYYTTTVLPDGEAELPTPLPIDAWTLTQRYFKFYHSWLPITPKHSIIRTLTEMQEGTKCGSSQPGVVWAIFALASAQQPCHDIGQSQVPDKYHREAMKHIPREPIKFEPGHVKVLVLLTVFNMARGNMETASLNLQNAIRAIVHLQRLNQYQQEFSAKESLNRIILAAFAMDTLLAAHLGTMPQLRSLDVCWAKQFDENDADEWDQWSTSGDNQTSGKRQQVSPRPLRALSTFKQYVQLLSVLNDSLCDLHPLEDLEIKLKDSRDKICSWRAQLPKHCQYSMTGMTESELETLPSIANLHLTAEAVSRFLFARRNISRDKDTQPSTTDGSVSTTVHKTAYQEAFGPAAWYGILDFHDYASRLEEHSRYTQICTSDRDYELEMRHIPDKADYSVTKQNQPDQTGLEMLSLDLAANPSTASNVTRLRNSLWQHPTNEGLFLNGIDAVMAEQVPFAAPLDLDGLQVEDNISGANTTLVPSSIDRRAIATAQAPSHRYDDLGDESSIETLLEELSAQQNVSWDEMEAQCMYNLGFMQPDHNIH